MPATFQSFQGLTDEAIAKSRAENGRNTLSTDARLGLFATVKEGTTEPLFILLVVACSIYFGIGRLEEGMILIMALFLVAGISVYQSIRSDLVSGALRELTQPKVQVRRHRHCR
jgi:Ca2+-transporting ATPase